MIKMHIVNYLLLSSAPIMVLSPSKLAVSTRAMIIFEKVAAHARSSTHLILEQDMIYFSVKLSLIQMSVEGLKGAL